MAVSLLNNDGEQKMDLFSSDMGIKQVLNQGTDMSSDQVESVLDMKDKAMDEGILDLEAIDNADLLGLNLVKVLTHELNTQLKIQKQLLERAGREFSPEPIQVDDEGSLFTEDAVGQIFGQLPFQKAMSYMGEKFGSEQTRGYRMMAEEMGLSEDEIEEVLD